MGARKDLGTHYRTILSSLRVGGGIGTIGGQLDGVGTMISYTGSYGLRWNPGCRKSARGQGQEGSACHGDYCSKFLVPRASRSI